MSVAYLLPTLTLGVIATVAFSGLGEGVSQTIGGSTRVHASHAWSLAESAPAPTVGGQNQAGVASAARKLVREVIEEMVPIAEGVPATEARRLERARQGLEEVLAAGYEALSKDQQSQLAKRMRANKNRRQAQVREAFLALGPGYQKLAQVLSSRGDLISAETQTTLASFTDSLPQHFTSSRSGFYTVERQAIHRMRLLWDAEEQRWRRPVSGLARGVDDWREHAGLFEPVMSPRYEAAVRALPTIEDPEKHPSAAQVARPIWVYRERPTLPIDPAVYRQMAGIHAHIRNSPKPRYRRDASLLGTGTVAETYLFGAVDEASLEKLEAIPRVVVDGESQLAVKLRKGGVEIGLDKNLTTMLEGLEKAEPEARDAFLPILDDLRFMSQRETDFRHEARAMARAQNLFSDPRVIVPKALFAADDIVVMELAPGGNLLENLPADNASRQALAADIGADVLEMLDAGFLHGDLHAGNILFDGEHRTYLDWGLFVELNESSKRSLIRSYLSALQDDEAGAVDALRLLDPRGRHIDDEALREAVHTAFERTEEPAQAFSAAVMQARLAGLPVPAGFGLAAKSLYQVDGVLRLIDPSFSFAGAAKVYAGRMVDAAKEDPLAVASVLKRWASNVGARDAASGLARVAWRKVRGQK